MGDFAALTHYATPGVPAGSAYAFPAQDGRGPSPPGNGHDHVGPLGDVNGAPASPTVPLRELDGPQRDDAELHLADAAVPYRLEIRVTPTFSPADYGHGDPRALGAQIQLEAAS